MDKRKRHSYSIRPALVEALEREVERRHAKAETRYCPATGKAWTLSDLVTEVLEDRYAQHALAATELI